MKLKPSVLKMINTPRTRIKLAVALDCVELTIIRYLKNNDDNLTKAAAMKVIKQETGLSEDEILSVEANAAEPQITRA